jgi:parallel beta-helix repeat protein
MDKLLRLTLLLACAGALHRGAHAQSGRDLYVANTGSDANSGSRHAPFRTIARAALAATAGSTVHVAPGTYRENVTTAAHGANHARIRYVSSARWGAKIIGDGTDAVWRNKGDYTDIADFDISGSTRLGIANHASHTLVSGNHVHNLTVSGGCTANGGAGIANVNYEGSDGDIIGNVVHDIGTPGQCNQVQGIYSSNPGGRIANNIVYRASAYGICLWHAANRALIANNTVFANGSVRMGGGIVIGAGDSPGGVVLDHTRVINNIVYNNPATSIREYCSAGEDCTGVHNTVANNLVFGNGYGIALRAGAPAGTIVADPQFVDYRADGNGNYRLKRSSPAIRAGLPEGAPATAIDNVARPRGTAPDIGAYQRR